MNVSRFSAASAAWTKDSDAQASSTGSCARSTTTDDKSSADASRTHRSSETYESSEKDSYGFDWDLDETTARISSAEDSPAKTSQSPGSEPDLQENAVDSSSSSHASLALFDPDGFSSRTYRDSSPRTAVGTSESCLTRWPTSGTAWPGGFSTHVSSECRSVGGVCSSSEPSLTEILEPPQSVPRRYSL